MSLDLHHNIRASALPEDISCLAILALQDFRREIQLVALALKACEGYHGIGGLFGLGTRPHGREAKVANLQVIRRHWGTTCMWGKQTLRLPFWLMRILLGFCWLSADEF